MSIDHQDTLRAAATRWYDLHLGEHLHRDRTLAAARCTEHLINVWNADAALATTLSLQVLGTIESRSTGAYIDIDRSTSHALFLVDPATGWRVMLSAVDVVRLARIAQSVGTTASALTAPPQPTTH